MFALLHTGTRAAYMMYWHLCNAHKKNCTIRLDNSMFILLILGGFSTAFYNTSFCMNVHTCARIVLFSSVNHIRLFLFCSFLLWMANLLDYISLTLRLSHFGGQKVPVRSVMATSEILSASLLLVYSVYILLKSIGSDQRNLRRIWLLLIYSGVSFVTLSFKAYVTILGSNTFFTFQPWSWSIYYATTEILPISIMCMIELEENKSVWKAKELNQRSLASYIGQNNETFLSDEMASDISESVTAAGDPSQTLTKSERRVPDFMQELYNGII